MNTLLNIVRTWILKFSWFAFKWHTVTKLSLFIEIVDCFEKWRGGTAAATPQSQPFLSSFLHKVSEYWIDLHTTFYGPQNTENMDLNSDTIHTYQMCQDISFKFKTSLPCWNNFLKRVFLRIKTLPNNFNTYLNISITKKVSNACHVSKPQREISF